MAVVKADAYGHGLVPAARAALAGGSPRLAVALVEEGLELRSAGIGEETPIQLLSEPPPASARAIIEGSLTPTVYTSRMIDELEAAAAQARLESEPVQLKIDTGMHRLGASEEDAPLLAQAIVNAPHLALEGVWTHLAIADVREDPYTATQIETFDRILGLIRDSGIDPGIVHAANSAGALLHPSARYQMVRSGIAIYGLSPAPGFAFPDQVRVRPALSWKAEVSMVKPLNSGERVSYGLTHEVGHDTRVATIPVGYGDGYERALGNKAAVLIRGDRHRVIGTVTMDHILADVGASHVEPGDEVTLLGRQGREEVSADELAAHLGTISYEIVTRIGKRVPRLYV